MKATAAVLAAIVLPGGFILAGIAVVGFVLARHRGAKQEPVATGNG